LVNEREILKDILVKEGDTISNLATIVKKAKEIFVVEDKTGKVIFRNYSKLKNHQKIYALLVGKYFSRRLDIVKDHAMNISEISTELSIPTTTLSSPLKSLKDEGVILKDKERYRVNPHRIEETMNNFFKLEKKD
jgi:DNA-binding transcriptional ArsR family regulator